MRQGGFVDVATRIADFIEEEILFKRPSVSLDQDTPLSSGLVDSLGMARLIIFLEEEFDVSIDHADMVPGHFRTVRDIEQLVLRKTQPA
jgi:acyl carrier protein